MTTVSAVCVLLSLITVAKHELASVSGVALMYTHVSSMGSLLLPVNSVCMLVWLKTSCHW